MSAFTTIRLVALREISTRIRSNTYRITTVLLALLAVGAIAFQQRADEWFAEGPRQVALVPATADLEAGFIANSSLVDLDVEVTAFGPDAALAALDAGDVDAVVLARDEVMFRETPDPALTALVARAVYDATLADRAAAAGITLDQARELVAPPEVRASILRADVQEDRDAAAGIAYFSSIVLFMAISFYGQWVMVGVVEEKTNRVVEVLLAVVAPWQMLTGKVAGIMTLAVVQIAVVAAAFVGGLVALDEVDVPRVTIEALAIAVAWLVVGVVLYNFVYAAVGATVTRAEEASSATMPVMLPLVGMYLVGLTYIPTNPDSTLSRAFSLFPLSSPLTMPARFAAGGVPAWEMGLAFLLAIGGIVGVVWVAGRIYAGAILQSRRIGLIAAFRRRAEVK